jgi:hypothetical protein
MGANKSERDDACCVLRFAGVVKKARKVAAGLGGALTGSNRNVWR